MQFRDPAYLIKSKLGSTLLSVVESYNSEFYWDIGKWYFNNRYRNDVRDYGIPISPFKLISIDPDEIEYLTNRGWVPWYHKRYAFGKVAGGRWDVKDHTFESSPIYQMYQKRFEEGVDWKDTPYIQHAIDRVKKGKKTWHCESVEEIDQRCQKMEELFEQFSAGNYRTQRELIENRENQHLLSSWKNPDRIIEFEELSGKISLDEFYEFLTERRDWEEFELFRMYMDEVRIDIGREGGYRFVDGRNRLALAKVADVDEIPVAVVVRHRQWMDLIQTQYQEGNLPDQPDLAEIDS